MGGGAAATHLPTWPPPAYRLACGQGRRQHVGGGQAGRLLCRSERNPHLRRAWVSVSRRDKRRGTSSFLRRHRRRRRCRAVGLQGRGRAGSCHLGGVHGGTRQGWDRDTRAAARVGGFQPKSAPCIPSQLPATPSGTASQSDADAFTHGFQSQTRGEQGELSPGTGNGNINPVVENTDLASLEVSRPGLDTAPSPSGLLGAGREAVAAGATHVFISRLDTLPGFNPLPHLSSSNPFPCKFSRRNSSCFSASAATTLFSALPQAQPSSHSSTRSLRYSPTGKPGI